VIAIQARLPDGLREYQNTNLGKFLAALEWKMSLYFMAITYI
jgi:hypothetical protein